MEPTHNPAPIDQSNVLDVSDTSLAFRRIGVADATPTGRQVLAALGLHPHTEYVILQWLPGGDIEEVRLEEPVNMSDVAAPRLVVAKADRTYRLTLNDRSLEWPEPHISEEALRTLGAVDASQQLFIALEDEADKLIEPGSRVNLKSAGVETIYSKANEWKLNVQGVTIKSNTPTIVVRDALERAGFDTDTAWIIVLKTASDRKQVDLDYVIDLSEAGVEKLRLTPREINNGEVAVTVRRDFALLPDDEARLTSRGYNWETRIEGGRRWLILHDVTVPEGYQITNSTIAMEIPTSYPMAEIDMFYCFPALARLDGRTIPQTQVNEHIMGQSFQRWSRHRGAIAPWRPGKDSVITHLLLIDESLNREVEA